MNLVVTGHDVHWRVFEREKLIKYLGEFVEIPIGDIEATKKVLSSYNINLVYWRPNSDEIDKTVYNNMQQQRQLFEKVKCTHINDVKNYMNYHAKNLTFDIWKENGFLVPKYVIFETIEELMARKDFDFPFLIRVNNSVNGGSSFLVFDEEQLKNDFPTLQSHYEESKKTSDYTKMIAVEYLDASKENRKYTHSYRIISTNKEVLTGYARLCRLPPLSEFDRGPNGNWSAFTGKFEDFMKDDFIKYQVRCQDIVDKHGEEITRAVRCLGMTAQGIDIIEDQDDNIYFLESQPQFSTGYAHWPKPYYNPYYPALVGFLWANQHHLKDVMPMYYNMWLDKDALFDRMFKVLKESKNESEFQHQQEARVG